MVRGQILRRPGIRISATGRGSESKVRVGGESERRIDSLRPRWLHTSRFTGSTQSLFSSLDDDWRQCVAPSAARGNKAATPAVSFISLLGGRRSQTTIPSTLSFPFTHTQESDVTRRKSCCLVCRLQVTWSATDFLPKGPNGLVCCSSDPKPQQKTHSSCVLKRAKTNQDTLDSKVRCQFYSPD